MKTHLPKCISIFAFFLGSFANLNAQSIHVVPNPNAPDLFISSGGGALSGYAGTPIILNNTLVLEYNGSSSSDPSNLVLQLAVYNGGDSLHLVPNPDAGQGVYFQSVQVIFNNKLFFIYINASGIQQLASFDGTSITLYPNPDAGLGYLGSPRIYNGILYVAYSNAAGSTQFGTFNGSGITLIPNPDNSTQGFYYNFSVVFNNEICARYITSDGTRHLAIYSGTNWTILPNPDNTTRGVIPQFPALYHNKLYFYYFSATNQYQFLQYDGTNNPTLVANPQDASSNQGGVSNFPIVFNDTLFFQYYNTSNILQLAKFDGTTETLVPNPDNTTYGFYNTPIVYNNNLYIFYVTANGIHHLTQYIGNGDSLKVYSNPDGGLGYWDQPIVYDNKLYFIYNNASSVFQLGYFGGSTIKLVADPNGIYNGSGGNNGYTGYPIILNNLLFMQFGSVPYGNAGNLAFIDGSTLPVTLSGFTVQKDGNTSLLQWKTNSEVNNAYFSIEHSADGISFQPIGKVAGHGTVSLQQQYQFIDNNPVTGINYYRLKQVDIDGNFTYSKTATVTFENILSVFRVFPNPATSSITISVPYSSSKSLVHIFDVNGKRIMEKEISAYASTQILNVSGLSAGMYQLVLVQGSQLQTIKLIKK